MMYLTALRESLQGRSLLAHDHYGSGADAQMHHMREFPGSAFTETFYLTSPGTIPMQLLSQVSCFRSGESG